ncbi:MAG TPA: TraR/DksA C4-type zinc finger protein [Limnochordales bacterium]
MGAGEGGNLGAAERERLRARLLAERRRLRASLAALRRGLADAETGGIGELSLYDQHPADLGSELAARQVDLGLVENTGQLLHQVEQALARLADGTYGLCEQCGQPIPQARLEAMPAATRCAPCQAAGEAEDGGPRAADAPEPSFAHSFDAPGGLDGEDVWRQLAQHGTANSPQDAPEEWAPGPDDRRPGPVL